MGLFDGTALERPILCARCSQDVKDCDCPPLEIQEPEVEPAKQRLTIRAEKRKRGKVMTVVSGHCGSTLQRQKLLTDLKHHCGAGGTIDANDVEIQGEHVARIRSFLQSAGYKIAKC